MQFIYPLSVSAAALLLAGCAAAPLAVTEAAMPQKRLSGVESVRFTPAATPLQEAQKRRHQVSTSVSINGQTQAIGYTTLMATGHSDNGEIFGALKDEHDKPIMFADGTPYICNGTNAGVGSGVDYSSILQVNGKLYMVSQFECQIGAMYKFELEQNSDNGMLAPKPGTLEFITQKGEFGGFVHCAGQATPWNSHLGSEEYESDGRFVEEHADAEGMTGNRYYDETAKYFGGDAKRLNPYYYGWIPEVRIDAAGKANYTKHYSMGRFSHELAYVMPDQKTVYMSDDGTNVGFYMFKADREGDLSSGRLYAAKLKQMSGSHGGAFAIEWIDLGHSDDAAVRAVVAAGPKFSEMFETAQPQAQHCPAGFGSVNTSAGHECLKIKAGAELAASRLETRRYAALKGATTELRKEEGITFDPVRNTLYVSMSVLEYGMENFKKDGVEDGRYDVGGHNDIHLAQHNKCGAVYALDIDGEMTVTRMRAVVRGEMMEKDAHGNTCRLDRIANPDNLTMITGTNILSIGEDSDGHENNTVWAYNVESGELSRLFSASRGAETTSAFWYTDVNGWGYMTVVTQHPDDDTAEAGESTVGVVGPVKFR